MKKYRVAVAGLIMGKKHVDCWSRHPDTEVVAVADLDQELCRNVADKFNVQHVYSDYNEMLASHDINIVGNSLPTGMHCSSTLAMLEKGCHVLCEKPPGNTVEEARKMADKARENGLVLGYALQRRFTDNVEVVKKAVADGAIGEPYFGRTGWSRKLPLNNPGQFLGWRYDRTRGGGSLLDLGVHMFDTAWYILGCPNPVSVQAMTSTRMVGYHLAISNDPKPEHPADDTSAAFIRFENDMTLVLESSFGLWKVSGPDCYCEITGTEGAVQSDPDPAIITAPPGKEPEFPTEKTSPVIARDRMVSDFAEAIETGGEARISAEQGVTLMKILEAIGTSADEKREVKISL